MKTVEKYIADDGTEFDIEDNCIEYERQCSVIDKIISVVPSRVDGCDFSNGSGYIQHKVELLSWIKIELLELAKTICPHKWIQQNIDDPSVDSSWVGRIISDNGHRSLNNAWYRFHCIDKQGREWGQPYYASNPHEAQQVQLNKQTEEILIK